MLTLQKLDKEKKKKKKKKPKTTDKITYTYMNGTEQETNNEPGKTAIPATVNPRSSVNTQIVQGLFDMVGPTSGNNNSNNNNNNNNNKGSQKGGDDLDDFFGFDTSKGASATATATTTTKTTAKSSSSDRNTAPPKTIQGQTGVGLKVIQEGEEVPVKSSSSASSSSSLKKKKIEEGEEDKEEEEEEDDDEDDDKDSDSDNDKAKNAAKQLSEEMNKARTRSASNQVASSSLATGTGPGTTTTTRPSSSSTTTTTTTSSGKDSGPSKAQTDALVELHRGTPLLKYPHRRGFPHFKYTQLSKDNTTIQWFSRKKKMESTCIRISDIKDVLKGQETQVFRKFQQTALEKASFSVVFGRDYQSLDLVAKSTDECDLWVLALKELVSLHKKGTDLTKLRDLIVPVNFKDRNRPQSRLGSGRFIRANESTERKVDSQELREVKKEMGDLKKSFERVKQLSQSPAILKSPEVDSVRLVISELEERFEELIQEINDTRDTEMSKRDKKLK
ncbi:hypothetical protein RFI_22259 [Reticulomyxa filosa]|uniref:PH domain-containing protein n=1 Tax=Reticulomyxa filosa TaxID=46433 RepID=X6MPT3_RETFI|nr:hypothetical protein RFI_22259 [Reticulomyxa filosa]|eukprot:ETO15105.1 hypothetical protein RFI_22259 [Reticulomyxa filosa]